MDVDVANDDGEVLDSATPSWFDQVVPGSSFSRSFKILNRAPVPLPFASAHLPENVPSERRDHDWDVMSWAGRRRLRGAGCAGRKGEPRRLASPAAGRPARWAAGPGGNS